MAKGQGYVNVGAIINPVDGLSNSLNDLSKLYSARSAKEQSRAVASKDQLYRDNSRSARKDTNEFLQGIGNGRLPQFQISDHSESMQKTFRDKSASINKEELSMSNYLNTGEDKYLTESLGYIKRKSGEDKSISDAARQKRKDNLMAIQFNLSGASESDRATAIKGQLAGVFDVRRKALDDSIASGSTMVKSQLATALMRYMPESSKEFGDFASIRGSVMSSLHGNTEQRLLSDNSASTSAQNKALKSRYDQEMVAYRGKIANYKKGTDYKALTQVFGEDIGSVDNKRRENIVDYLMEQNMPHSAIVMIVDRLTDESIVGSKSIYKLESPEAQKLIHDQLGTMRAKGELTGIGDIRKPKPWKAVERQNLDQIQRGMLTSDFDTSRSVLDVSQEWRDNYANRPNGRSSLGPAAGAEGGVVAPVPSRPALNIPVPQSIGTNYNKTMESAAAQPDYSSMIAGAESSTNSKAVNGQYLGSYQMGSLALQDAGYKDENGKWTGKNGIKTNADYLGNDKAQKDAFDTYSGGNELALTNSGATEKIGQMFQGVMVTMNGLKAAAHLVGATAVATMLETGEVPVDGNGTKALSYLHMGSMNTNGAQNTPTPGLPGSERLRDFIVNGSSVRRDPDVPWEDDSDSEIRRQLDRNVYNSASPLDYGIGAVETVGALAGAIPGVAGYVAGSAVDVLDRAQGRPYANKRDEFASRMSILQIDGDSSNVAKRAAAGIAKLAPSIPGNMSSVNLRALTTGARGAMQIGRSLRPKSIIASRNAATEATRKSFSDYTANVTKRNRDAEIKKQTDDAFAQDEFTSSYDKRFGNPEANAAYDKYVPKWDSWKAGKGF